MTVVACDLAVGAARRDASVDCLQVEVDRRRNAQLVIDLDVVRREEEERRVDADAVLAADRQRVAVERGDEVAVVLLLRVGPEVARADVRDERDLVPGPGGDVDAAVDAVDVDALDAVSRPAARDRLDVLLAPSRIRK